MWTDKGELRAHWQQLGAAVEELGPAEIQRRWDQVRRMIHENGVTYNVHGESHGMDRPWELDPLPLVISASVLPPYIGAISGCVTDGAPSSAIVSDQPSSACARGMCHLHAALVSSNDPH